MWQQKIKEQDRAGSIPPPALPQFPFPNSLTLDLSLHLVVEEIIFSKIISGFAVSHKIDPLRSIFPPLNYYVSLKDNAL